MDAVIKHYRSVLDKTGLSLDGRQLLDWAKSHKAAVTAPQVYKFLRESTDAGVGSFARSRPVRTYQTVSPLRPGVFFIDYGEFHKSWSGSNNGSTGFLVAVENITCRLFVLPTRGKDTQQWLDSIAQFVELSRQVSVLYSDRDSVALSQAFRQRMMDTYGIRWHFLRSRHKSFLAERYIGYVKTKLSQALDNAAKPTKRWIDFVNPLVKIYNDQKIPGTAYKRRSVSRENFNDLLTQLFGKNYDLRFSSYAVGEFSKHPRWNKRIFKFSLGDRVRVNRRADWADPENRLGFAKVSSRGAHGKHTYPVVGRQLRYNRTHSRLTPVYSLGGMPQGAGFTFYEEDLVLVSSSSSVPESSRSVAAATAGSGSVVVDQ